MPSKYRVLALSIPSAISILSTQALGKIVLEPGEQQQDMRYNLEPDEETQFRGIGSIQCKNDEGGVESTGFIAMNNRMVVTVAHYRFSFKEKHVIEATFNSSDCLFLLRNPTGSQVFFASPFEEIASGWKDSASQPDHRDWALLRLKEAAPITAVPLDFAQPTPSWLRSSEISNLYRSYTVGYSGSNQNPYQKTIAIDCKIKNAKTSKSIIRHACDTGPGSSGSPILIDIDGRPFVFAINTADGTGNFNIGLKIGPELVAASGSKVPSISQMISSKKVFGGR
ncbi:trypsin-like serine peptidase [Erythrobacter sp. GH1-10]|uniref:trypsin-like serine peptidase n=1 Tax=Erythrobacter sp. GH1-10 TaxID=3349334 RepID=UPI003877EDDA